jgi:dihydrofolate synthase / folylpolyglutamate synthase
MSISELVQFKKESDCRFNTLDQWLAWQETNHFTAIELGLDRCRKVAESMHLLPPTFFVISIAGTNGKGSSARMLESILRDAGYKIGLYTSPHLLRYNERIKVDGQDVSDVMLCESFEKIDQARNTTSLTYFEFSTIAAIDIFQRTMVDIAIMEVGMGGRLDAVNMLDANVSEKWLGPDRETIGMEKAGIIRSMRPAICSDANPPLSLFETAKLVGANLLRSGKDFSHTITDRGWSWETTGKHLNNLPIPANLSYQIDNASGVLMVLQEISNYFPVERKSIVKQLRTFRLPGRFQVLPGEVPVILDVAHNRQSASVLAENINKLPKTGKTILVLGMLKDKNHKSFISELSPFIDNWYLSTLENCRGCYAKDLAAILKTVNSDAIDLQFDKLEIAISSALSASKAGDRIIIAGSFVTVGMALKFFKLGINSE